MDETSDELNLISCGLFLRQPLFHAQTRQKQKPKQRDTMTAGRPGAEQKWGGGQLGFGGNAVGAKTILLPRFNHAHQFSVP